MSGFHGPQNASENDFWSLPVSEMQVLVVSDGLFWVTTAALEVELNHSSGFMPYTFSK